MRDPFGSMNGFMGQFRGFIANPIQYMMQKNTNIPQEFQNDPNKAIQYMMNNGQISQDDYNKACQIANQIQKNPQFMKMFGVNHNT